jgi:acetyl esterase
VARPLYDPEPAWAPAPSPTDSEMTKTSARSIARAASLVAASLLLAAMASGAPQASAAERGLGVQRDLPYLGPGGPALDVFAPDDGGGSRPAVIVVHGGGWVGGDRTRTEPIAVALARAGFVAVNVGYTLVTPERPGYRRQPREIRAAVRYVRANAAELGVDPTRIASFGSSAGGHLAALVATAARGPLADGSRVRAVVTWSAPLTIRPPALRSAPRLRSHAAEYVGCYPCARRAGAASPLFRVSADDPPMLIVNSRRERVPAVQAVRIARRLRRARVPRRLLLLPGRVHSQYADRALGPTIAFLRRRLG